MNPMNEMFFWNRPLAGLLTDLDTSLAGLASHEAERRLARFGPKAAADRERVSGWIRFLLRFRNPLVVILLVASVGSPATGDVASFIIVVAIVVLSVVMDFVQETRAQKAVEALRDQVALRAQVVRDGRETTILVRQLVPGDVVHLAAGDLVPRMSGRDPGLSSIVTRLRAISRTHSANVQPRAHVWKGLQIGDEIDESDRRATASHSHCRSIASHRVFAW